MKISLEVTGAQEHADENGQGCLKRKPDHLPST
jgi:hypothetical protein